MKEKKTPGPYEGKHWTKVALKSRLLDLDAQKRQLEKDLLEAQTLARKAWAEHHFAVEMIVKANQEAVAWREAAKLAVHQAREDVRNRCFNLARNNEASYTAEDIRTLDLEG